MAAGEFPSQSPTASAHSPARPALPCHVGTPRCCPCHGLPAAGAACCLSKDTWVRGRAAAASESSLSLGKSLQGSSPAALPPQDSWIRPRRWHAASLLCSMPPLQQTHGVLGTAKGLPGGQAGLGTTAHGMGSGIDAPCDGGLGEGNRAECLMRAARKGHRQLAAMHCRSPGDAHFFPTPSPSSPPKESDVFGEE